jgi:hypothetical protein
MNGQWMFMENKRSRPYFRGDSKFTMRQEHAGRFDGFLTMVNGEGRS